MSKTTYHGDGTCTRKTTVATDENDLLAWLIMPIKDCDKELLRTKIALLKTSDGEDWAVGELLERAMGLMSISLMNNEKTV